MKTTSHPVIHMFFIAKKPRPLIDYEVPTTSPVLRPVDREFLIILPTRRFAGY